MSTPTPSQMIPYGKVDEAYDKLHAEHERLKQDFDILNSALHPQPLPCGHPGQYAYTTDGGKHIICLVCKLERPEIMRKQESAKYISNCCSASKPSYEEGDICPKCKEHCEWEEDACLL